MMKRFSTFLLISISVFLITGCLDIQENIFLKKDGSGRYTFTIDMSELKTIFGGDGGTIKTSTKESKNPSDKIDSKFDEIKQELKKIEGISNITQRVDTINIIVNIGFDFKDIDALNKAVNILFKEENQSKSLTYYSYKDNQFKRLESASKGFLKAGFEDKNAPKNKETATKMPLNMDGFFQTISYTTTYEFENEIKKSSNAGAIISNKNKIILKCYPFVEDSIKRCSLTNTITLN